MYGVKREMQLAEPTAISGGPSYRLSWLEAVLEQYSR